ncbi:MAG: phage holin family protein [Actinomycetota bacterium]|nr:phage holin family protein [Actinomycetota bacterium]
MEANNSGRGGSSGELPTDERSISELVQQLTQQTSELARKEVELAKAEVTAKGKQLGIGAGAFGAAGVVALYAGGALTATLILALATFLEGWLAALIVTVVYAAIAGIAALTGKKKVEQTGPPVPQRAIDSTRQDIEAAKRGAKEGRS